MLKKFKASGLPTRVPRSDTPGYSAEVRLLHLDMERKNRTSTRHRDVAICGVQACGHHQDSDTASRLHQLSAQKDVYTPEARCKMELC